MFRVYAPMDQRMAPAQVADHARRAEALGYDGLLVPEAVHDGLVMSAIALSATTRLRVATSVLVAFPRSPMTVAHAAWDLQSLSGGRFELGLGSQVRGNIEGRYSTAWAPPAPRMREYVQSLRAIFASFQTGATLAFEGDHYRFTRLQPFFNPGPLEHPEIPIWLGAVGPRMTEVAGEVADGLVTHPTNSAPRYLREAMLPRVARGAARAGRDAGDARLLVGPLVATGPRAEDAAREREKQRELLGFLFSTPAYWPSLELFGHAQLGERLRDLSREQKWSDMPSLIGDDLLDECVPAGPYAEIAEILRTRYGNLTRDLSFPLPSDPNCDPMAAEVIERLRH